MTIFKQISYLAIITSLFAMCNGQLKKEVTECHDDGSPKCEHFYKLAGDKKEVIKEIQYFENGHKKIVGHYKNGKKDGKWTFWYVNGEKQSEGYYIQDIRTGQTQVYHENGKLFYKGKYTDGQKDGEWTFYNSDGKPVNLISFDKGKVITQKKPPKGRN